MRTRTILMASSGLLIACNAVLGLDPVTLDPGASETGGSGGANSSTGGLKGTGSTVSTSGGVGTTAGGSSNGGNSNAGGSTTNGGSTTTNGGTGNSSGGNDTVGGDGSSGGDGPEGGTSQGGTAQGGTSQGGTSQGGTSQGGTGTGGKAAGGTSTGGTTGGTGTGGKAAGGTSTGGTTGGTGTGGKAAGGTSTGGTTGGTGTGGKATGGTSTGGTSTGGTSTGGTSTGGTLNFVAAELDGKMMLGPCLAATGEPAVCTTRSGACPVVGVDRPVGGALLTDSTVTIGGTVGTLYSITLRIQGVVEAKDYTGGTDSNATGASPNLDGFRVGGTPGAGNSYNSFLLRVSDPSTDYFLNSLVAPGIPNRTTYGIDYQATIQARGGSTVRLVLADPNCSQSKNCGPGDNSTSCPAPIIKTVAAHSASVNPQFDFTKAYNGQFLVMMVVAVVAQ